MNIKWIQLEGSVAVFCDPRTFPSDQDIHNIPENMYIAVGFHPRHAKKPECSIKVDLLQLGRLIQHPRVVALGDIGIDHTEPRKYWAYQIDLLEKVLPKLDRHVLVIHCRGMKDDCGTEALFLEEICSSQSTNSSPLLYNLQRWFESFPMT